MKIRTIVACFALVLSALQSFASTWRNGERQSIWPEGKIPDFQEHQIGAMTDEVQNDAEWRAARRVRSQAKDRGFNPEKIGVIGMSAGGHLSTMLATSAQTPAYEPVDDIDKLSCKVQWACPIYPAYALTDGADKPNVTRGNDDSAVLVPEFSFDADTPPMCFIHGDADDCGSNVPMSNRRTTSTAMISPFSVLQASRLQPNGFTCGSMDSVTIATVRLQAMPCWPKILEWRF